MPFSRGRFAPSAEHAKSGMTVLVPRPIVDAEQRELMGFLTSHKVQNLIIFLRRGGVRHLDINETLRQGEYKGLAPLHVGTMIGTSSVVNALLELANADPDVRTKESLEAPLLSEVWEDVQAEVREEPEAMEFMLAPSIDASTPYGVSALARML